MPSRLSDLGKDSIRFLIVCGNSGGSHFSAAGRSSRLYAKFRFYESLRENRFPLDADKIYDEPINDRSFPVTLFDRDNVED